MADWELEPISSTEHAARLQRVKRIAARFGYVGQIEYRHVLSSSGGAQYGFGLGPKGDLLAVYADAFRRDADPDDFSMEAIIAHERGHQIIARSRRLQAFLVSKIAPATEEILASLLGSLIVDQELDRQALILKALEDTCRCGLTLREAVEVIDELRDLLEQEL